jgi:hypothetical protein
VGSNIILLVQAFVCIDHRHDASIPGLSVSISTCRSSSLSMANGRTREKIRSWFSRRDRRRDVPSATIATITKKDGMLEQETEGVVVAEESSIGSIVVESPEQLTESVATTNTTSETTTRIVQVIPVPQGQDPSRMLVTGKWQVLPRRQGVDYTLEDAFAEMDIDINKNN